MGRRGGLRWEERIKGNLGPWKGEGRLGQKGSPGLFYFLKDFSFSKTFLGLNFCFSLFEFLSYFKPNIFQNIFFDRNELGRRREH
jgi:hypothetical protein